MHIIFLHSLFSCVIRKIILPSSLSFFPKHEIYYLQLKKFCHSIIVFQLRLWQIYQPLLQYYLLLLDFL